jgi:hypothetical protein
VSATGSLQALMLSQRVLKAIRNLKAAVCIERVKMVIARISALSAVLTLVQSMLAKAALNWGFATFLCNLIRTHRPGQHRLAVPHPEWFHEYYAGFENEIYSANLEPLAGVNFHAVVQVSVCSVLFSFNSVVHCYSIVFTVTVFIQ